MTASNKQFVFKELLKKWREEKPQSEFVKFYAGESWNYERTYNEAANFANYLYDLGVRKGDLVLCWLPNSPLMLRSWLGINMLGAVFVPFNTQYRGAHLHHILSVTSAKVLITHPTLLASLNDIDPCQIEHILVGRESELTEVAGVPVTDISAIDWSAPAELKYDPEVVNTDRQSIIFTSGTTGLAKGVVSTYEHLHAQGVEAFTMFGESDRALVILPLFHCSGTMPLALGLWHGASIGLCDGFNARTFWDVVRDTRSTFSFVMAIMPAHLLAAPPTDQDKQHTLRTGIVTSKQDEFRERFGTDTYSLFNMSEVCTPLFTEKNTQATGSSGRRRPGVEVKIVDADGKEVEVGTPGQLLVRPDRPYMCSREYLGDPEATAAAWKDGWFHTGDLLREDADGNFYFLDRLKDTIRRRGENISSLALERTLLRYPGIIEAAAVGVQVGDGETEILVYLKPVNKDAFSYLEFFEWLEKELPRFMIPRFVRLVDDFEKTPTGKIKKVQLRDVPDHDSLWDRRKAGLNYQRQVLD